MSQIRLFPDESAAEKTGSASSIQILSPADVLDTLSNTESVDTIILDPWYNKGVGGTRPDYHDWLSVVIAAASEKSQHIFVWGFPEILAFQIPNLPAGFKLVSWLTWYYKNCPSVIRGWRSAQNACLHLARDGATLYPENFLNGKQLERWQTGKMRFVPGPPSVLEAPLNVGFVGRHEQTGHPAQKPLAVIEPLILMSTKENDTVLDPICGKGTSGEDCLRLNRRAVLCDSSEDYLTVTRNRVANYTRTANGR